MSAHRENILRSPAAVPTIPAPRADRGASRMLRGSAWLAFGLSVAVFMRRGFAAWQAATIPPGTAITSGFESESHFAVWRAIHGFPVFLDGLHPPFASAYFNWMFYSAYGAVLRPVVAWHGDAALVPAGRLFTALIAACGGAVLFGLSRAILRGHNALTAAIAAFVFGGPLVGWWAHTVRPDVAALAFEAAGIAVFLLLYRRHPFSATIASLPVFYAAWSWKQTTVAGAIATFLFLLVRRQRSAALAFAAGGVLLVAATFVAAGTGYRLAQAATAVNNLFSLRLGLDNLTNALVKSAPLLVFAAFPVRQPEADAGTPGVLARDAFTLSAIGVMVALPLAFVTSCKVGASVNYYFSVALMTAVLGVARLGLGRRGAGALVACTLAAAIELVALAGSAGNIDLRPQARSLQKVWTAFAKMPEPRFSADLPLALPWLNSHSPPMQLGFNYPLQYATGQTLEAGGIGGSVNRGAFASLLLPANCGTEFFGGQLDRYVRINSVDGFDLYVRRLPATLSNGTPGGAVP